MRSSPALFPLLLLAQGLTAQPPVLAPTADISIQTGAVLHYASINIPVGVTVRFVGSQPALVRCDGDAQIDGVMTVSATYGPVPGETNLGSGGQGWWCNLSGFPGSPGQHRGVYGSDLPFSLLGGSPGGGCSVYGTNIGWPPCTYLQNSIPATRPGGTLVLRAGGRIDVRGSVQANGEGVFGGFGASAGSASSGSILLAGMTGLRVFTGASVTARTWLGTANQDGYVRLDAAAGPPVLDAGSNVWPLLAVELPHLRAGTPRIGLTWDLITHSEAGQWVVLYLGAPIPPAPTPFGVLGIDPGLAVDFGVAAPVGPFEDPSATVGLLIPGAPQLVGATLHVQGAGLFSSGQLRLSNVIVRTVQN
jgi:hypothetical protein